MASFSPLAVAWVTLALTGQWSLVFLLATFFVVTSLPQRRNPFLINLLITTCLATFPPSLLFYTGQQSRNKGPRHSICVMQSVLLDGVVPMFGTALAVLVFKTWSDMWAAVRDRTPLLATSALAKWTLLLAPYAALSIASIASLVDSLQPTAHVRLLPPLVFCTNISERAPVRKYVGYFVFLCGIVELFFEVWTAYLIFTRFKHRRPAPAAYRPTLHMAIRLFIFSLLQFTPIILVAINRAQAPSEGLLVATQVIESMDAFVTFVVFGTQRSVLETWKILTPATSPDPPKDEALSDVTKV